MWRTSALALRPATESLLPGAIALERDEREAFPAEPTAADGRAPHTNGEWLPKLYQTGQRSKRARGIGRVVLEGSGSDAPQQRAFHFIQPLKERVVREVGYGLSLEGASAADLHEINASQESSCRSERLNLLILGGGTGGTIAAWTLCSSRAGASQSSNANTSAGRARTSPARQAKNVIHSAKVACRSEEFGIAKRDVG